MARGSGGRHHGAGGAGEGNGSEAAAGSFAELLNGDSYEDGQDSRGFAMRRGRCRRLRADHGRESRRGRAAFARSVNASSGRKHCCWDWDAVKARRMATRSLLEGVEAEAEAVAEERREARIIKKAQREATAETPLKPIEAPPRPLLSRPPRLQRSSSVPCTAAERRAAERRAARAAIPLAAWQTSALLEDSSPRRPLSGPSAAPAPPRAARWHRASQAAAAAAAAFFAAVAATAAAAAAAAAGSKKRRRAGWKQEVAGGSVLSHFGVLQRAFLKEHGPAIRSRLKECLGTPVELTAAPLSLKVKERFVEACKTADKATLRPVYHGTEARNHRSIFDRGLLVPGDGSGVAQVRNGLSHGRGIYTATLESPWLSKGFCTEPRMLVCGVLDDAVEKATPERIGNFMITKESASVRHVGAAIVVFDAARVAPLFEAVWRSSPPVAETWASRVATAADAAGAAVAARRGRPLTRLPSGAPSPARGPAALAAYLGRRAARRRQRL